MVKDTIQAVREAEEKAKKLVLEASEKGRMKVEQTKKEAAALRDEASRKIREEAGAQEKKLSAEGEAYLAESVKAVEEEIASLKKNAEEKADAVAEKIIEALI